MTHADRFAGHRAVVAGGASGIGLGVATRLAAEGAVVCLWDVNQEALDRARASSSRRRVWLSTPRRSAATPTVKSGSSRSSTRSRHGRDEGVAAVRPPPRRAPFAVTSTRR